MRLFGGLTIRRKLTSISMLSSLTALVSATLAFLAYDGLSFRESLARRIQAEAQIVSFNSISPLLFDDAEAANSTLAGLKAEPAISHAAIFGSQRPDAFARYARDSHAPSAFDQSPPTSAEGHTFAVDHLLVTQPIQFEGRRLGTLAIRAELGELRARQRNYAGLGLAILAVSFLMALALSRVIEKTISRPILHLADTARAVSARNDYSVRATAEGRDEVGALVDTFNQMLDRIQHQNADLEEARLDLERRVAARTRDLATANRELEAFSYSVSHDLRAPLRAIDGFSKALVTEYGARIDERGHHYLDRVRAGTQRMAELIDDLLGLARVSRRTLARQRVSLSDIAAQVSAELVRQQPGRGVRLDVDPGLEADADPHLLKIAFENLLGNAWKFTSKSAGAHVEVGMRAEDGERVFYVRDNGAGFDMVYAKKLFGPFQRLHSEKEFPGTGIGLATVYRIADRHGGRVWAEGALGKGATMSFSLPGRNE